MLTAKLENLIITKADLKAIHEDSRILKSALSVKSGTLYIANNAHAGITDQHQMLAKGIVYHVDDNGKFNLVSLPFPKFYNSFESVCLEDMKTLDYDSTEVVKKQDGSLISRFVWDGQVYFATRGNILTPDKLFYNPVMKLVLLNHTGMEQVGQFDYEGVTYLMEYVGPSNVILEPYEKDELVGLSVNYFGPVNKDGNWKLRCYDREEFPEEWNVRMTPMFDESDPQKALDSMTGIQEGVIVNYIKSGRVVYRTKFKHEDYIKALKSRSFVDKMDPVLELIENKGSVVNVLAKYEVELELNPYKEELLKVIEDSVNDKKVLDYVLDLYNIDNSIIKFADKMKSRVADECLGRKEVFEAASSSELKPYKGLIMKLVYGWTPFEERLKIIYKVQDKLESK